jgi:prophage maintenance system killer protein
VSGLGARELLLLHAQLADYLGTPRGVADPAAAATVAALAAAPPEADLFEHGAQLAGAVVAQRPFASANTALAVAAVALLLRQYDLDLQLPAGELGELRTALAAGDMPALTGWLRAHTVPRPLV